MHRFGQRENLFMKKCLPLRLFRHGETDHGRFIKQFRMTALNFDYITVSAHEYVPFQCKYESPHTLYLHRLVRLSMADWIHIMFSPM